MLLFRSLTTGLLGACVLLLVRLQPPKLASAPAPVPRPMLSATIVDVSPAIRAAALSTLVRLSPGEHVVAIDDQSVANDLVAGTVIGDRALVSGQFLDLTVSSASSSRRVLLLMH